MDNARVLLLEMAKDYLNHSQLEEATDKQYGKGVTKYIGSAIYRYYGVENLEKTEVTKMETKEIHTGTFILGSIVI